MKPMTKLEELHDRFGQSPWLVALLSIPIAVLVGLVRV